MRDPQRIESVLDAVRNAWQAEPDMRLGQLLYNAVSSLHPNGAIPPCPPLFYVEDAALVDALAKHS